MMMMGVQYEIVSSDVEESLPLHGGGDESIMPPSMGQSCRARFTKYGTIQWRNQHVRFLESNMFNFGRTCAPDYIIWADLREGSAKVICVLAWQLLFAMGGCEGYCL